MSYETAATNTVNPSKCNSIGSYNFVPRSRLIGCTWALSCSVDIYIVIGFCYF